MIGKHSPNNKQQKTGKSFEICVGLPCKIKAKLYFSIYFVFILQSLTMTVQQNISVKKFLNEIQLSFDGEVYKHLLICVITSASMYLNVN